MHKTLDFKIRYAHPTDLPEVLRLANNFLQAAFPSEEADIEKFSYYFKVSLENKESCCLVLVTPLDELVGFVFANITELYFLTKKVAVCTAIWVEPEYRHQGLDMITAFEKWAVWKEVDIIAMSSFTDVSPKKLGKIYEKRGYRLTENIYWKGF